MQVIWSLTVLLCQWAAVSLKGLQPPHTASGFGKQCCCRLGLQVQGKGKGSFNSI